MRQTTMLKPSEVVRTWYVVDATDATLGRLSTKVATVLRGKHKPTYTPNAMCGDYVIIINAEKVVVSGKKNDDMLYRHYTGFVHGLREYSFGELIERKPTEPLERTIWGMLPHNRLGRKLYGNLKVYAGADHPHAAQNPKPLEV